jgi:hypothetical protein
MSVGRTQEAHDFLTKYHGGGDPNAPIVKLQMQEMTASYDESPVEAWYDYRSLFATHGNRWRMVQVMLMGIFGQFSGNGLAYYITIIFEQLGIKSVAAQLGYNILFSVVCAIGALAGASLADHMPRRRVLVIGPAVMAGLLAIFVGLNALIAQKVGPDDKGFLPDSLAQGALAVYMLFGATIAFVYTPLQSLLPVEALSNSMRAKGLTAYTYTMVSFDCLFSLTTRAAWALSTCSSVLLDSTTLVTSILLFCTSKSGANTNRYSAGFDGLESVIWYFCAVESCGRTLEEMDDIYAQPYPPGASKKRD